MLNFVVDTGAGVSIIPVRYATGITLVPTPVTLNKVTLNKQVVKLNVMVKQKLKSNFQIYAVISHGLLSLLKPLFPYLVLIS